MPAFHGLLRMKDVFRPQKQNLGRNNLSLPEGKTIEHKVSNAKVENFNSVLDRNLVP